MRVVQLAQQPVQRRRLALLQIQRMHTHRAVDVGIALRQRLDCPGVVGADADTQEVLHTTGAGGSQRRIEGTIVGRQVEAVEVAVGINQHGISLSLK